MKYDFSVLIAIHQRSDIELNFENLVKSIFSSTIIPKQTLIMVDGPISLSFKRTINNLKKKNNFQVYFNKEKIGLADILNI